MSDNLFQKWTEATSRLDWGKQRVLHDTLTLAAEGKIKVVYGADDYDGSPCLINAVGCMVKSQGEAPSINEPVIVSLFDQINRYLETVGVNPDQGHGHMSELAAETLVRYFAPLKEIPETQEIEEPTVYFVEPTDEELQAAWEKSQKHEAMDDFTLAMQDEENYAEVLRDVE